MVSSYSILLALAHQKDILLLRHGPRRPAMVRIHKVISTHSDQSFRVQSGFRDSEISIGTLEDQIVSSDRGRFGGDYRPEPTKLEIGRDKRLSSAATVKVWPQGENGQ